MTELDLKTSIKAIAELYGRIEEEIKAIPHIKTSFATAPTTNQTELHSGLFVGSITITCVGTAGAQLSQCTIVTNTKDGYNFLRLAPEIQGTNLRLIQHIPLIVTDRIIISGGGNYTLQLIGYKIYL